MRSTVTSSTGIPLRSSPGASNAMNRAISAAEQDERKQGGKPRGSPDGRRLHHTTSKKPIQPNSANSETWAWNMYLPS